MSKRNKNRWSNAVTLPQLAANRANSALSTGPVTSAGKAISSLNAVTTGLTGRTVLLPTDDIEAYEQHMRAYEKDFAPVGQLETDLVRSIAETVWRLQRIPSLEAGIYAAGHIELADQFADQDPTVRPSLIHVAVHLKYERQLRNLHLQESRLVRRREKELAELRALQAERKSQEQETASRPTHALVFQSAEFAALAPNGFEFSNRVEHASDGA